jgi:exonuclease SbcD
MSYLQILHLADVHLDTPFYGREESLRRKLRDACRGAFRAAVDLAIERHVHAFLIAGDLFDNDLLSFTTERFLLTELTRLKEAGIPVFYATGNHDPGRANYRAQQIEWPENVHLFTSTQPETVAITNRDGERVGWLTAAGHTSRNEAINIAARYESARKDLPHVAMLHTQIVSARGAEHHERYAPATREDLAVRGFDYWALGHVHVQQHVFEDLPIWYSGNLQGRNPKETGPKGILSAQVHKDGLVEPEFIPLAPVVWDCLNVPCPPQVLTLDSLSDELARWIQEHLQLDDGREHLLRVDLTGESAMARELAEPDNLAELGDIVQEKVGLEWMEIRPRSLTRPIEVKKYRGSPTVLGEVLELLGRMETDDELLKQIGSQELANKDPENRISYLRSLLAGLENEAVSLLVPEKNK